MADIWMMLAALLAFVAALCSAMVWWRVVRGMDLSVLSTRLDRIEAQLPSIGAALREEQRLGREELAVALDRVSQRQEERLQVLGHQQGEEGRAARAELSAAQQRLADVLAGRLEAFDARLVAVSDRLDASQRQLAQQLVEAGVRDREGSAQTLQRFGADLQQVAVELKRLDRDAGDFCHQLRVGCGHSLCPFAHCQVGDRLQVAQHKHARHQVAAAEHDVVGRGLALDHAPGGVTELERQAALHIECFACFHGTAFLFLNQDRCKAQKCNAGEKPSFSRKLGFYERLLAQRPSTHQSR